MKEIRKEPVDIWIIDPIKRFISNSTTSGIMLFSSALLAMVLANSPWSDGFHHLWEVEFGLVLTDKIFPRVCITGSTMV